MTAGRLHTIATRTWDPPTGPDRDAVRPSRPLGGRIDLLVRAAGVLFGTRRADEHDPRHKQATHGAPMLPTSDLPKGRCQLGKR
jgi:hypothetical protein